MSDMYVVFDMHEIMSSIPHVTAECRWSAERAGQRWAQETQEKLEAGLEIWRDLMSLADRDMKIVCSADNAKLFGIAIEALEEGKIRDCLLMHTCEGTLERLGCDISGDDIENIFLKLEYVTPDIRVIRVMCTILGLCCEYASQTQGYPFALLAYLLWWAGKFDAAYEYVGKALERDSSNSLASLLLCVIEAGVVPPWLARKCGAFHSKALE